jgi:hypothetical protein
MNIRLPSKEEIARLFSQEELPEMPEGMDFLEMCDMSLRALKIAIEEFPLEEYKPLEKSLGYNPRYSLTSGILEENNIPGIMLLSDEEGLPLLYLRIFMNTGGLIGDAICNLWNVAGFFMFKASWLVSELKKHGLNISEEEEREFIVRKTANMLKSAFKNIKKRAELAVNSYLEEVWWDWAEIWYEHYAESNSLLGIQVKRLAFAKDHVKQIEKHKEEIRDLWKDDSETLFDLKKQVLALKYRTIYEHWKEIERMQLTGKNWRRYVKAGDMSDIDDDLIEDFENGANVSGIAIEHAARRAELYNIFDVREKRLEKRKRGIKDSGYSRAGLFKLKKEGEELLKKKRKTPSPPPDKTSGLESGMPVH